MSFEEAATRSRRALLFGAIGGLSALVAHALGRPSPLVAGGGSVQLGTTNMSSSTTTVQNNTAGHGFVGAGLTSGVSGIGSPGPGVSGSSVHGLLSSQLPQRVGVHGIGDRVGVQGRSPDRVGVLGIAGGAGPASMPPNVGAYGWSTAEGGGVSMGLLGRSTAQNGYGVFGTSDTGTGVVGFTDDGTAVSATVSGGGSGRALVVSGRAKFSTSGITTVSAGNDKKIVDPGIPLSASSKVLATVMGNPGGSIVLKRVVVDAAADTFTIVLTGAAANSVPVAWFVLD